jgi:pyrimidine oxygenase
MLFMVIADETDEAAMATWQRYVDGADREALAYLFGRAADDKDAADTSTAKSIAASPSPINFNMGTIVGSYATCARLLDEAATMPGVKGLMLTFDDFLLGMDSFGQKIQQLMACRSHVKMAA